MRALTARLPWLVAAQLLVVLYAPLAGAPAAVIPLAAALVVALAVATVVALDARLEPAERAVVGTVRSSTPRPARQCDPDAAGHVRPRAPGR